MLNPETVPFTYKGIEAHSHVLAGGGTEVIFAPLWVLMSVVGSISKQLLSVDSFFPLPSHIQQICNESPLLHSSNILAF